MQAIVCSAQLHSNRVGAFELTIECMALRAIKEEEIYWSLGAALHQPK
jgi:hypothetical protein